MSAALNFPGDQIGAETQAPSVTGDQTSTPGQKLSDPQRLPAGRGAIFPGDQGAYALQKPLVTGDLTVLPGQRPIDSHTARAGQAQDHLSGQSLRATQSGSAAEVSTPAPGHIVAAIQVQRAGRGPILADPFLGLLAATVDDLELNRKALQNRHRALTRDATDKDGEIRGFALPAAHPDVKMVRDLLAALGGEKLDGSGGIEHQAVLKLNAAVRRHLLWTTWGKDQKGLGEKTFARFLAAVGDPYWNGLHERPRLVSELWSYCGYGVTAAGVAPKMMKGQKVNWSPEARMRMWNITASCLKAQGYYADVYYIAQAKYADATHNQECSQCTPKGAPPAPVGSPLKQNHKHARALRIMAKEILKDLWTASKALHEAA